MFFPHPVQRTRLRLAGSVIALCLIFIPATCQPQDAPITSSPEDILKFLNQTLVWYRLLSSQQQLVNQPSDSVFLDDNRQIADQVVRLSFEYARAEAQQIVSQNPASKTPEKLTQPSGSQYQNLISLSEKSKQEIADQEKNLQSLNQQLSKATGKKRATLQAAIATGQDELEFLKARSETIQNILQFASGMNAWTGVKGLQEQIDELARTVPGVATGSSSSAGGQSAAPQTAASTTIADTGERQAGSGLFGLIAEIFEYRRKLTLLDNSLHLTDRLADSSKALRSPIVDRIKQFTQLSEQLASTSQTQSPADATQQQPSLKDLTQQYKQLSAAILPLGKQSLLLDLYKRNVSNWQNAVATRYSQLLKTLLIRVGTLVGIVIVVLGISYIWRRATFRYVQDNRRRHQFLIVRRIIVIPVLLVVIVVAFANGLGSVTLFAGLSTAGLAVALQNLLQALVGYFVLIGKFGVRVGDRIQVSGVSGEVIDVGMLRLHVVEMSPEPGSRPTGRVVAFSNSIVFQPNAGLFKQIPGTNFVWREVSLTVAPDTNYRELEKRMLQAVNRIFDDYKERMEKQRRTIEAAIHGFSSEPLNPESRIYLTPSGTQIVVRYPVEVDEAADLDNRIAREVLDATGREPHVEAAGAEVPGEATATVQGE